MVRPPMAPGTALSDNRDTMPGRVASRVAHVSSVLVIVIALTMAWAVAARPASAGASGFRTVRQTAGRRAPAGPVRARVTPLRLTPFPISPVQTVPESAARRELDPDRTAAGHRAAASIRAWRISVTRHYGATGHASGFSAVVAPRPAVAWAFGGTNPGRASTPVALRWTGTRWRSWPLPRGLDGFIGNASAPSASDIWATSYGTGYVLHWNGTRWSVAKRWPEHHVLTGVTAISPSDVWVFGTTTAGVHGMGTWHYNGRSWVRVRGIAGRIYRASAVSARDIWAVAASHSGGFVEHYDGHAWRRVPTVPALARASLDDVLACSRHGVWIVGNRRARTSEGRLFLAHFDGRRWAVTTTARTADTGRLAAGLSGLWVTADASASRTDALIGHLARDSDGRRRLTWTAVRGGLGTGISDIAAVRGTGRVWLSGGILTRNGGNAALWSRARWPRAGRHRTRRAGQPGEAGEAREAGTTRLEIRPRTVPLPVPPALRSWRSDLALVLEPRPHADVA